jgi:hypothetical protein
MKKVLDMWNQIMALASKLLEPFVQARFERYCRGLIAEAKERPAEAVQDFAPASA